MRTLAVVLAILVVALALFSSGSVSGQLCARNLGCVKGDTKGFRLEGTRADGEGRDGERAATPARTSPGRP
jgi:cobalamin synthase